jgi:hypothetical protein
MGPTIIWRVSCLRLWGKQTWPFSRRYPDGTSGDCALANAQIIQFAPYLARKQEQEVKRLLARLIHHSPILEGDIRAWVAAMIEWSARY